MRLKKPTEKSIFTKALFTISNAVLAITILIFLVWGLFHLVEDAGYTFRWPVVFRHLPAFNMGLRMTLHLSAVSFGLSVILGLVVALGRLSKITVIRNFSAVFVHGLRNIPLLIVIALFNWGLGAAFRGISLFTWSVLALSIFQAAYLAEIFRGGILAIPHTQMDSARSLGLTYFQSMRDVVLPQAMRNIVPAMTGQIANLVKDSSLVSVIGFVEITLVSRQLIGTTFAPIEIFIVTAAYYFAICFPIALAASGLEIRLQRYQKKAA